MKRDRQPPIRRVIGCIPNRFALAGGWIDQPFVSRHNPRPPGSMVVVSLDPTFRVMDRAGCATGTRGVAMKLWKGRLPDRAPHELVRELYYAENQGKSEPSGSQDMIGLVYPGISRLDYDFAANGGIFPTHIESLNSPRIARWLENVLHVLPIEPRPEGYNPLGVQHLHPKWIARLGQSGKDCFDSIEHRDLEGLGASMNECMLCWEKLLPHVLHHPVIKLDLKAILRVYQKRYAGAMYSGCGGGYLFVASREPVPGAFRVNVRLQADE
ncbi:MAG TPA: hypothetical protein VL361_09570 [Candidatus Limnocylindrales bacterium]|nr:hypothetical protein [Candidatus Limnocylindrales bacterium]